MMIDDDPATEESGPERLVRRTPWWFISVGLHALILLVIGFFWIVEAVGDVKVSAIHPPKEKEPVPTFPEKQPPRPFEVPEVSEQPSEVEDPDPDPDPLPDPPIDVPLPEHPKAGDPTDPNRFTRQIESTIGSGETGNPTGGNGPLASRISRATRCEIGAPRDAVLQALKWLARHQNGDGSWSVRAYTGRCTAPCSPNPGHEDFDAGVTGLSMLAFLGAGYSHLSKDVHDDISFGDVVRKGLQWMFRHQDPEGCIGSRSARKYMYNHLVCALAATEAYGLTGSNLLRENARAAVDFTVAAQNPGSGWRYGYRSGDNDTSVTGWAVMVLKSAEMSKLVPPRTAFDGARAWLDGATETAYSRTGYTSADTGKVFVPGLNEQFDHHPSMTGVAVMCRTFMDRDRRDPRLRGGVALLSRDLPEWQDVKIDFYYWYCAAMALYQASVLEPEAWKQWNAKMVDALCGHQNAADTGCRRGSWEPVGRWCGEGGRVYATAINALTLEVYYRYGNVFGNRSE